MLRKLLTFEKDLFVFTNTSHPIEMVERLHAQASNRKNKLALTCLLDFFKDDRDALTTGRYKVVVTENLIKGCTYNVFYAPQ